MYCFFFLYLDCDSNNVCLDIKECLLCLDIYCCCYNLNMREEDNVYLLILNMNKMI